MTFWAAAASLSILAVAGVLPAWAIVGRQWIVAPLAPLCGALLSAVAGTLTLAIGGSIVPWFVGVAAVVGLGVLAIHLRWISRARAGRPTNSSIGDHITTGVGAVLLLAAALWSMLPLRVPSVGWDARAIWMLRASWFAGGHTFLIDSFRDPIELLAHSSYPPLVSTSVAVCWQITGTHSDRLGVIVVALLNVCAATALGWVLIEGGIEAGRKTGSTNRRTLSRVVGVFVGPLIVLTAFGAAGPFATNGYADPLWAFAATASVGYGLLLPWSNRRAATALILAAVAGLTKEEGVAVAITLVVLIACRSSIHSFRTSEGEPRMGSDQVRLSMPTRWHRATPWLVYGAAAATLLCVWPVMAHLLHAPKDVNTSGPHIGTFHYRANLTFIAMRRHLHVLLFAVPIAVVGALILRGQRKATGLGNDAWAWAAITASLLLVGGAYAVNGGDTPLLLLSADRTTIFPVATAWLTVGCWAIAATGSDLGGS